MTRPMPGPPDWYDIDWNPVWGMVWIKNDDECDQTFNHAELDKKRLTMEGCAAHEWQAASTLGLALYAPAEVLGVDIPEGGSMYSWERPDAEPLNRAYDTWHRFATRPHALEVQE